MRVLVAGDRGYIGAVLVPFLRAAGHQASGLDLGLTEGCDFGSGPEEAVGPPRDIRDARADLLADYDAVVCLAALSNDPLGNLNPAATYSVNLDGTLALARAARNAGVDRFLFSSSCSLYGAAGSAEVAEDAQGIPGHALWRGEGGRRAGAIVAGRRIIQPDVPDERHRLRRLTETPAGHSGEQPHRHCGDNRQVRLESDGSHGGRWCTWRTSAERS